MKIPKALFALGTVAFLAAKVHAQNLTTLHSFASTDGYLPFAGLTQGDDGNFYGVTEQGGANGTGAAYRITPAGSFTLLTSFGSGQTDAQHPHASLIKGKDGNFYGTTVSGGSGNNGTVYQMTPAGAITVLHSFSFNEGVAPTARLLLAPDGNFYGTTPRGGSGNTGTIFKMAPDGTVTVLHPFSGAFANTNSDGVDPEGGLILGSDGNLYGMTRGGGNSGIGTIFIVTTSGNFLTLYTFGNQPNDGAYPDAELTLGSDGNFYGTCDTQNLSQGAGFGVVFKMSTGGTPQTTTVQNIYAFQNKSDGGGPHCTLLQGRDGSFYGTTIGGGSAGAGTIFKVTPAGSFTLLYTFTGNQTGATDGANPWAGLVQGSDGGLYGTTTAGGGSNNAGTVFRFGAPLAAQINVTYEGKIRDRVSQADNGINPDGQPDATFTVQLLPGSGAREIVSIDINRGDGNEWDTIPNNGKWVVGAAATFDSDLLNGANGSVDFSVPDGARFKIFAPENGNLFSDGHTFTVTLTFADNTTASATVAMPSTNGLAATSLTVNGSSLPSYPPAGTAVQGLADTVLQFAAQQIGSAGAISITVEATTTPNVESSWTPLPNATNGVMFFDPLTNRHLLSTDDYPHEQGDPVYFRAIATAPGYDPSVSNVVGPFNLTSSKARFGTTELFFTANGSISDFYFKAIPSATPSGLAVRVQSSTTPGNEQSWADLPNGGAMMATDDPSQFVLFFNKLFDTRGVYFRAIATAPGYVDSISNFVGPFTVTSATPPSVTVTLPDGMGAGSKVDPRVVTAGSLHFHVTAQSDGPISQLALLVDNKTLFAVRDGTTFIDYSTTLIGPGLHVVEALAIDNRRATARAVTGASYLQVRPAPPAALRAERVAGAKIAAADSTGTTYTAVQDFFWTQGSTWRNETTGKTGDGFPGPNDFAIIGDHHVVIDASPNPDTGVASQADITVASVSIDNGGIRASDSSGVGNHGNLTITGTITVTGGATFDGILHIFIAPGAVFETTNANDISFNSTGQGEVKIFNNGTINLHGSGKLNNVQELDNSSALVFQRALTIPGDAATNPSAGAGILDAFAVTGTGAVDAVNQVVLTNQGHTKLITGDGAGVIAQGGGNVIAQGAGNVISHDGGTLIGHDGGSLIGHDGGSLIGHDGGSLIGHDGGSLIGHDGGSLIAAGGGNVVSTNRGGSASTGNARAETVPGGFVQNGGATNLNGVMLSGPVTVNGGSVTGTGVIIGDLTNNGGYISPGGSSGAGTLAVLGNFTQDASGTTIIERSGPNASQFDQLQVSGTASLGGKLDVKDIDGYTPNAGDTFNPLGYSTVSGSFGSISSNAQLTLNPTGMLTSVDVSKPQPSSGQPLNISTRMEVLQGDNVLIAGFIVSGPPGSTKKVMIRGLGPSLAQAGVANPLADPLLELHEADGTVITNDDWQQGDTSQIPTGFSPASPKESVIIATLTVGAQGYSNYTAVLKGANGETGVGLAEAYDLDSSSSPAKFANISTRGYVDTGDNVMIGGFIVGGSEPTKILVRAIGPSLTNAGVQGALQTTSLELHDANGAVIGNQGWRSTQEADIIGTTIPPTNDRDSAIVETLVPGNYTAVVRGVNNTTGVGLVEAYNLQ